MFVVAARKITRHEVVKSNEANMLSGLGLLGEGFVYPGHADSNVGFSRFTGPGSAEGLLHSLHMSHNVTMDQCDEIVERHQLLAPHAVWLVNRDAEEGFASAERLGDCGLFLGARSSTDADLWRAFYRYARMILRLGHVDTWLDDDIVDAVVHSSAEKACNPATSKVCLWWSEFDLDEEEYSCRPKRDASNIVTPSILLATLAANNVAYPPPSPPPPTPPSSPPHPSPPPGAIRCELTSVPSTDGRKVPGYDASRGQFSPVQQQCWRWDQGQDWPPFTVHRDIYKPRDRCGGAFSRDVQWDGGFNQPELSKSDYDRFDLATDDCPWMEYALYEDPYHTMTRAGRDYALMKIIGETFGEEDGANCKDATNLQTNDDNVKCDLGTNTKSCGISNIVVFGYAGFNRDFRKSKADDAFHHYCVSKTTGKMIKKECTCADGGPGSGPMGTNYCFEDKDSVTGDDPDTQPFAGETYEECFYGTHGMCAKRRFAFLVEDAGPDEPEDSCPGNDDNGNPRIGNGVCEDGLMWSFYPPGKNPCAPNTDVTDCGWRMPKRTARVELVQKDTCRAATECDTEECKARCADYSDDSFAHGDPALHRATDAVTGYQACGRGTSTSRCRSAAAAKYLADMFTEPLRTSIWWYVGDTPLLTENPSASLANAVRGSDGNGTMEYNKNVYHEKTIYVQSHVNEHQPFCTPPPNIMTGDTGMNSFGAFGESLVYPYYANSVNVAAAENWVYQWKVWYDKYPTAAENKARWVEDVCSDGGEGSFRVPLHVPYTGLDSTKKHPFVHMDFACPYGSQPGVCPDRDMTKFQRTQDDLAQPKGPPFPNCFDEGIADFECCHAENSFRIHGGGGDVGQVDPEKPRLCRQPIGDGCTTQSVVHAEEDYDARDGALFHPTLAIHPLPGTPENPIGPSFDECRRLCETTIACRYLAYYPVAPDKNSNGYSVDLTRAELCDDLVNTGFATSTTCWLFDGLSTTSIWPLNEFGEPDSNCKFPWDTAMHMKVYCIEKDEENGVCPLHYTSYYGTPTGCKAFCRMAFQREGNDNTCVPGKPECANWLDGDAFPKEYVTVNAECICGAKLPELQESGKYVHEGFDHTGTVLQGSRARERALHEDDSVDDDDHWEWPNTVDAGIDQFHNAHFDVGDTCIAEIMRFRTDLLNGSDCDNYLDMDGPPIDLVEGGFDPTDQATHELCAADGRNDAKCCVLSRGEDMASRLWMQTGDMQTASVAESFGESAIVGTVVHTSRVAAVGNFDNDDFPDIIIGNRLYLNREWVLYDGKANYWQTGGALANLPSGEGAHAWRTVDECKALCLATPHCNSIEWSKSGTSIPETWGCWLRKVATQPVNDALFDNNADRETHVLQPTGKGFD